MLLALFWAWSVGESAQHTLESQHVHCDEHGVLEDLASTSAHGDDSPAVSADANTTEDGHAACVHGVPCRGSSAALAPPASWSIAPPAPQVEPRHVSPVPLSDAPRGPPLLALAAKTSPPCLA